MCPQPHNEWEIKSEALSHQTPTTKGPCMSQESCCYGNQDDLSDMESVCEEVKAGTDLLLITYATLVTSIPN